jgi:tRNA pseudouridine55 synthase
VTPINGLLLVKKPSGVTSHDLVDRARKIFQTREVGHAGTLDPLASGLMVLLLGQATKLSPYIMDGDKAYTVEVQLGLKTDMLDITGKTVEEKPVGEEHIQNITATLKLFEGEFQWPVPMYSAVKVGGQKLYELARENKVIETPKKVMKFWNLKQTSDSAVTFWVELECSKGSFIRTWVDQFGDKLGTGACMKSLIRTKSAPYSLDQALTLEETKLGLENKEALKNFVPMSWALPLTKKARVQTFDQTLLLNGQISHDLRRLLIGLVNPEESCLLQAVSMKDNRLLALIAFEKGQGFKIKRVFNTEPF